MIESAYKTLRVGRDASPEHVREAYVRLVRRYPPEHFPEKFASLRQAYQQITLDESAVEEILQKLHRCTDPLELAGVVLGDYPELQPSSPLDLKDLTSLLLSERGQVELNALLESCSTEAIEWREHGERESV